MKLRLPRIKIIFGKIKSLLLSPLPIGGLQISNTSLKFLLIKNNTITQASLRLPPGIIHKGQIMNQKNFIAALKKLHLQVSPLSKSIAVVLTLSPNLVYTQAFSVPIVDRKHLKESIKLNLQMLSPNKIEESYYDWQVIAENKNRGQVDLLGAFISSKIADSYRNALKEAGFNIVTIEFPGLALARLIRERWGGLSNFEHYLLISINNEGILMIILKSGSLYFSHFNSWEDIVTKYDPKTLKFDQIKNFVTQEIQRVSNFYLGKFGKPLKECILVSSVFNQEIFKIASEQFSLKVRNLIISELPNLKSSWFPVLGSALRGLLSRSKDVSISLTKTHAQKGYYAERGLRFLAMWRNITLIAMAFVLVSFIAVDTSFYGEQNRLREKKKNEFSLADIEKNVVMQEKISTFNGLLDFVEQSIFKEKAWSPFLEKIDMLAGKSIAMDRILASENDESVVISAKANNEAAAIGFKNRLQSQPDFTEVSLPLSNIKNQPDGTVNFGLTFKIGLTEE